jgi:hypothetical protein
MTGEKDSSCGQFHFSDDFDRILNGSFSPQLPVFCDCDSFRTELSVLVNVHRTGGISVCSQRAVGGNVRFGRTVGIARLGVE